MCGCVYAVRCAAAVKIGPSATEDTHVRNNDLQPNLVSSSGTRFFFGLFISFILRFLLFVASAWLVSGSTIQKRTRSA